MEWYEELYYGIILWNYITNYITELYYGIVLQSHGTELCFVIISWNFPHGRNPGDPWGIPRVPWDLRGSPGTPLGHPGDAPKTSRDPHGPNKSP